MDKALLWSCAVADKVRDMAEQLRAEGRYWVADRLEGVADEVDRLRDEVDTKPIVPYNLAKMNGHSVWVQFPGGSYGWDAIIGVQGSDTQQPHLYCYTEDDDGIPLYFDCVGLMFGRGCTFHYAKPDNVRRAQAAQIECMAAGQGGTP